MVIDGLPRLPPLPRRITTVFVPKRNEPDLDDVPSDVLETINVIMTTDVAELVAQAIEPAAASKGDRVAA